MDALTYHKITHALTEYDRRQERSALKRRIPHNIYALAHYLGAAQHIQEDVDRGVPLRRAITDHLHGRLVDAVLKAVGEPKSTDAEQRMR